jgi:Tfp pilus assembly protein PilF
VVLSAAALFGQYVWKMFWPADLCAFYVFRKSTSLHDPRALAGIGIIIGCILAFWWLWQHARMASFGVVWFVLTLGPVLNPRWMAASVFTERYLYLPSVGFCWIVAWGAVWLWECARDRKGSLMWRRALVSALVLTGLLCLARIVTRNRVWRDDLTLYTKTLEAEPDAMLIHTYLGIAYWNRGYVGEAEKHWNEVLRRFPNSVMDLNFMGWVRVRQKRYAEADYYFRRALRTLPTDPEAHLNLGGLSKEMGRIDDAELHLRAAVALAPMNSSTRDLLGELYLERERIADAEEQFQRSVAISPHAKGYNGLGEVYVRRHEENRAEQAFKVAVGLDPFDSQAHFALGRLYAKQGDVTRATREYQLGLQTDPQNREASAALEGLKKRIRHANPPAP